MVKHPYPATVPRLWPHSTIVCIGGGPSLTKEDVNYCHGKARVIAISDAIRLAPWADCLYSCDGKWYRWHKGVPSFQGPKYALDTRAREFRDVQVLKNTGREGLELDPTGLKTGSNSGYQAIGLAYHLGASRILLLGYDMQKHGGQHHWFGDHPEKGNSPYVAFVSYFTKLAPILQKHHISVINCSRRTALTCFPRQALTQALPEVLERAS